MSIHTILKWRGHSRSATSARPGTLRVNDPDNKHNGPWDPIWCHSVAVTGAKLFDLYNPRGIHQSHLSQENKPYFLLLKKV